MVSQKMLEIKKHHHYVWADYLRRWSNNNRDVFYTTKNKKIASDSVKGMMYEYEFYKLENISDANKQAIIKFSGMSNDFLHQCHMEMLQDVMEIQEDRLKYAGKWKLMKGYLEAKENNLMEDIHSVKERSVSNILKQLASHNISILDNQPDLYRFMDFLGNQISRTKTFKCVFINSISNKKSDLWKAVHECWFFFQYMLGQNMSYYLTLNKHHQHTLLINHTSQPFITSDIPVINIHEACAGEMSELGPSDYEFYYPISPTVAYILSIPVDGCFRTEVSRVTEDRVNELNIRIAKRAMVHIVGKNEASITPYVKYVRTHFNELTRYMEKKDILSS